SARICEFKSTTIGYVFFRGDYLTDFNQQDVEILRREPGFRGFYRLDVLTLRHRLFAGGWGPELRRELFVRPDAVCVLPYDPWQAAVVLIEQLRVGALGKRTNPWLLELVAGQVDDGAEAEQVAHREAEEEAGLTLLNLTPITRYFPSPGGSDEQVYLYCATVPRHLRVTGRERNVAGPHEDALLDAASLDEPLADIANAF